MAKRNSISKTAVWILLGLLILGLGGFGATNLSGNIRTIGSVGDKSLPVENYARQLQQEIRAREAQTGAPMTFAQAQSLGLDRAVLSRMVQTRALDHETSQLGLSIGDESLRSRVLEIQAFQGIDGEFDRDSYRFALEQSGLSEARFETQLREEVSRTLLQGAIVSGVVMPPAYADTLMGYVGEERDFTWTLLDEADLSEPLPVATDEDLRSYYDDNIAQFTLPESKSITYALLTPDALIDDIEVDEAELRDAYEAREAEFNQPERRLIERLVYLDDESADQAAAALEVGNSFEGLVEERGLELSDVDLGDISEAELGAAGAEVFAASVGDVVGPLASDLGPALFRVNGILPAQSTSFEDARETLQDEQAADRALRLVEAQADTFDDLLAGGATLEELAAETDMELGQIDWSEGIDGDIAGYEKFRELAAAVTPEDFPQIDQLDDGSLVALRLDNILPPRPADYADVTDVVSESWIAAQTAAQLRAQLETQMPQLEEGADFAALGLDAVREEGITRSDRLNGAPRGFVTDVFEMETGDLRLIEDATAGTLVLVRLDAINPPSENAQTTALSEQLSQQINQALAQDIFDVFNADVTSRAEPQVNPQAVHAVHANFQ